jgi:hypothetical protein
MESRSPEMELVVGRVVSCGFLFAPESLIYLLWVGIINKSRNAL